LSQESERSAATNPEHVALTGDVEAVRLALRDGPRGALIIGSISVALLLAGWLAFYFLLFLPRGGVS
jgi:hypothetical protein